jgi:hypothetical protein
LPTTGNSRLAIWQLGRNDDDARARWEQVRAGLLASYIHAHPGTRPWAWWRFDSPRATVLPRVGVLPPWLSAITCEPRRRLAGTGTAVCEVLNCSPEFAFGRPTHFLDADLLAAYQRRGNDLAGAEPYAASDPPVYESEAEYLRRHALLEPAAARRLTPADFEPEIVEQDDGAAVRRPRDMALVDFGEME